MVKLVIICFFISPLGIIISYAQDNTDDKIKTNTESHQKNSIIKLNKQDNLNLTKNDDADYYKSFEISVRSNTKPILHPDKVPEKLKFDIISSYRNNIHFGGFWNGYAIVNFTPAMYIQPFDFISVYAIHHISMYIPIKGITENIKSLVIESAAVLAVDNSVKFLLSSNHIVQSIVGFAAKNLVISFLRNIINNTNNNPSGLLEFKYYYYSVSIRF